LDVDHRARLSAVCGQIRQSQQSHPFAGRLHRRPLQWLVWPRPIAFPQGRRAAFFRRLRLCIARSKKPPAAQPPLRSNRKRCGVDRAPANAEPSRPRWTWP